MYVITLLMKFIIIIIICFLNFQYSVHEGRKLNTV